ncbi:uncharacterized protein MELLADRAFT_93042 [Melampsora larici-populina 98AG31]|uniref:Uncharacterized protein n=1 Tax=Melampsora larici-populina (strain 98AG31 / pathotype 3-4-7) TaxID=747676 RepID=F4S3P8_MELLP|nr:uncharacterized protein MELLADRAFT_93042 [Melampsora larici-populina 98AG31]EGG00710.1 hypothetical protein MELLADRAFT_93042 [Melampsora larici-populina 98AG31]
MREFQDRRDRTSWACSVVPQHVTQPSISNNTHHPYPDPDHSSESKPLSLTTSCLPSGPSSGSPHLQSSSPHSALTPSLPPVYTVQRHQNRFFTPAVDSQETADGVGSEQRGIQSQSTSEHRHHQLTPLPQQFTMMSETWYGLVQTPRDAYLLLEACRVGKLYRITRRLTDMERSQIIRPGAVFVWEEKEAGIKRWTDHVRWSPSRVSGAFLIYSELLSASSRDSQTSSDPLLKQSFSSTTLEGDKLHLIAYYSKAALDSGTLPTPTLDSRLSEMVIPPGIYPDHRATSGVEDDSVRERQRMSLLARHSNASLLESVPSATSVESTTSSIDAAGRMQPITPTSTATSMPLSDFSFSHIGSLPESSTHRATPDAKIYMSQPKYSPSNFVPAIYPISHGIIDSSPSFNDRSGRWQTYQPPTDWINPSGVVGSVTDPRNGGYGRLHSSGGSTTWGPTLPPLTTWQAEPERERGGHERRFSTSGMLSSSLNGHSFHPYARPPDSARGRSSGNHNYTSKESTEPTDTEGLSHAPSRTPGTPNRRGYNLPSMNQQPTPQSCGSMGPPPSTKSDSPSSNVGQSRPGNGFSNLSPHFGSNCNVQQQLGNGLYQANTPREQNISNNFHRTDRLSNDIGNETTVSNNYPDHQHHQNIQPSSNIKSSDHTPASDTASQHDDNHQSLVSDQYESFSKNKESDSSNFDFEEED